jgi:hypothetical protein
MMFHRAEPDENGLGVMTSTLGLTRSSKLLICLGLPARVTSETTESVTMPLFASVFQDGSTSLASTRRVMSVSRENAT